ncbi:MAG: haloacid dehalogenase type II [Deltaproteobacteria bacterium]|nr:haloacid dehalogenase type II [Deltaproteobacteria bacterium]
MKLSGFKVLTFDCYGTLIDWETGILNALQSIAKKKGLLEQKEKILETFAKHENRQEIETPGMRYSDLLALVYRRIAGEWNIDVSNKEAENFGGSVPSWPAFSDTVEALQYLKRHYKLVILSNVDQASFSGSNKRLGVKFDAIYTAEEIGSYKPDPKNFEYMLRKLETLGFTRSEILHTAQSLFHDHVPAKEFGLTTAWIDRRHGQKGSGATPPPPQNVKVDFHFKSLAEFVEKHRTEVKSDTVLADAVTA